MARAEDVALGWPQAQLLGFISASVTAAGTTSANATVVGSGVTYIILTATGSDGIRLASDTPLLRPIWVANVSGSNGKVYPPTSGIVNGGSADAGETIGTTTVQIWMRHSATLWSACLGA